MFNTRYPSGVAIVSCHWAPLPGGEGGGGQIVHRFIFFKLKDGLCIQMLGYIFLSFIQNVTVNKIPFKPLIFGIIWVKILKHSWPHCGPERLLKLPHCKITILEGRVNAFRPRAPKQKFFFRNGSKHSKESKYSSRKSRSISKSHTIFNMYNDHILNQLIYYNK